MHTPRQPMRMKALWMSALILLMACSASCATPVPKPGAFSHSLSPHDIGLPVDLDLLRTSSLPESYKPAAEELLIFLHTAEQNLQDYSKALEDNLTTNTVLTEKYDMADAIVGGIAGLTAIGVVFATEAIVVPIAGALWVATGLSIQHFSIAPVQKEAQNRIDQAKQLMELLPDIKRAFDALLFAESEGEAERRFKRWKAYVEDFKSKVTPFFAGSDVER